MAAPDPDLARLLAEHERSAPADAAETAARRAAVLALCHRLGVAADRLAAARLLVDSERRDEVAAAQALALAAMATEPGARVVAATAYDRLRLCDGLPQKFGTQRAPGRGAGLWPVDPATTDSERSKWGLPSLAELRRRAGG